MMDTVTAASASPTSTSTTLEDTAARLRLSATRLARILRQQSDAGFTPTQLAALATIDRSGPLPIGVLADIEQITPPTATKVVDKLHAAGCIERHPDPDDRRVTLVSLSPAGRKVLARIRARKTAWLSTRLAELPASELALLTDALDVLDHLTSAPSKDPA
jgi:DNA-binding MarR family transcriptional regulator